MPAGGRQCSVERAAETPKGGHGQRATTDKKDPFFNKEFKHAKKVGRQKMGQNAVWVSGEKLKIPRLKDDVPTKSAASKRIVHECQSSETVNDDTKTGATVLGMVDMQVKAHLIWNSARIRERTSSRPREYNSTLTATRPKDKGRSKDAKGRSKGNIYKERVVQESESGRSEKTVGDVKRD